MWHIFVEDHQWKFTIFDELDRLDQEINYIIVEAWSIIFNDIIN